MSVEHLIEYGIFAAKFLTVIVGISVPLLIGFVLVAGRARHGEDPTIEVKRINDRYRDMKLAMDAAVLPTKQFKQRLKDEKKSAKQKQKGATAEKPRLFLIEFKGDIRASAVSSLREEITAILTIADDEDEVVIIIESAGGTIHGYGLAASQLRRIKDKGVRLTAVVDKIAASGGYMMACVADKIVAAPFSIVGSIGVVAQLPNFNRLLKKHDIDFEQVTAGKFKRTLTLFGENTDEAREKFQEEIEDAHQLFKSFVTEHRPQIELDQVATGEHWFGSRALELKLVDEISTSDAYISAKAEGADVYIVRVLRKKALLERIFGQAEA